MSEPKEDTEQLIEFAKKVWPGLELSPFHESYYRVLDAFAAGKIRRLIVTVPPQHGKSLGSSVLLPAYMLGRNPDLRIAIASYSASLANKFNKRAQRVMDTQAYRTVFPEAAIKGVREKSDYVRTADRVEMIGRNGELMSVGREGSLTGNQVDVFIIDDLYKDAMEANSPTVRENCLEWYVSVVKTRMHNASSELIVFTRWHCEDLIGSIGKTEEIVELVDFEFDGIRDGQWALLNFEAIKESPKTVIDPRESGEALWPERHNAALLVQKRKFDSAKFECMYQGKPSYTEGLLYGDNFCTYDVLPRDVVRFGNYTDTADTGDDYLCSVCYAVDSEGVIYVTDVVYSKEKMEVTEELVCRMLAENVRCDVVVESNNGGRGFARAIARKLPSLPVGWFHQGANKEARIISNSSNVLHHIRVPCDWKQRWEVFALHLVTYQRVYRSNRWHDAPDVLTGIFERECVKNFNRKIKALSFVK